jgi:hypothetical protein
VSEIIRGFIFRYQVSDDAAGIRRGLECARNEGRVMRAWDWHGRDETVPRLSSV